MVLYSQGRVSLLSKNCNSDASFHLGTKLLFRSSLVTAQTRANLFEFYLLPLWCCATFWELFLITWPNDCCNEALLSTRLELQCWERKVSIVKDGSLIGVFSLSLFTHAFIIAQMFVSKLWYDAALKYMAVQLTWLILFSLGFSINVSTKTFDTYNHRRRMYKSILHAYDYVRSYESLFWKYALKSSNRAIFADSSTKRMNMSTYTDVFCTYFCASLIIPWNLHLQLSKICLKTFYLKKKSQLVKNQTRQRERGHEAGESLGLLSSALTNDRENISCERRRQCLTGDIRNVPLVACSIYEL